jgi:hypothetical protein
MIYSVRGMAVALAAVVMLAGFSAIQRAANFKPAKATVSYIDRECDIIETRYEGDKETSRQTYRDTCSSIDDWDEIRTKRTKRISGKAVVHVVYTAPQTGQETNGELRFDGRDDEFYALNAGDQVDILVSNSDPTKIRKA